jgi:Xaa-Pro aminopeptidase
MATRLIDLKVSSHRELSNFVSLSFPTISSSGCNGAVIHYCPTPDSARKLSTHELYLCDSGAQYFDGTTDITRTVSFGEPSPKEKVW